MKVQVNMHSSAASMTARRGAGRVLQFEVRELWVQDRVAKEGLSVVNVEGEAHVTYGLTKHVDRQKTEQYVKACSMVRRSGRHKFCPRLGDGK